MYAPTKSTNGPYHATMHTNMYKCHKTDNYTNTALHSAVWVCHLEIVKFLVEEFQISQDSTTQPGILKNLFDTAQYLQKHSVIPYIYAAIGCLQLSK